MMILLGFVGVQPIQAQQQGLFSAFGEIMLSATTSTFTGTLGGVELTLTDSTGAVVAVVESNSSGGYVFPGLTTGTYIIAPYRTGATFFPSSTSITITSETVRVEAFRMTPALPIITGRVVMQHDWNIPFPFATITITNTAAPNAVLRPRIQSDGTFSIAVATAGTYSIAPEATRLREGFIITPPNSLSTTNASTDVFVDASAEVRNNRFTLTAFQPRYRLQGSVRFEYEPSAAIIDVTMLSAQTGAPLSTITTLATVTGEPYMVYVTNASYRITARLTIAQSSFYVGVPSRYSVDVRSRAIDTLDFTYIPRRDTIRGRIIRRIGNAEVPVANVTVRLAQFNTNYIFDSTQSRSDGTFLVSVRSLNNTLPLHLVLPPPIEYSFSYQNTAIPVRENIIRGALISSLDLGTIRQNITLEDIIATPVPPRQYTIQGRVLYRTTNAGVREPLTIIVTNANNSSFTMTERRRITLDEQGNYTINVTAGTYEVSFLAERHIFNPPLRRFDVPRETEGINQNFQAVLEPITLSGIIQTIIGTPITNASIRVGGGGVDGITVQTDEYGRYRVVVPEQSPGSRFFLVPNVGETTLYPPARLVVVNLASPVLTNMDFRATSTTNTLPLSAISGRITIFDNGVERGLADVNISDGTRNTKTDANGNYVLQNVPNGSYTLTAALDRYAFTPPSLAVSVIGGTRPRNQNFVARFQPVTFNLPPVVQRQPNDIPVIASTTTRVPILPLFSDPNGDALTFTSYVEDPTILRTRMVEGVLLIDALSEGNTMINIVASDNRGGSITASFRVTVNRPVVEPRLFTRPKGNINTNYNAALVVQNQALTTALLQTTAFRGKDAATVQSSGGELGAFNSQCECVGAIVWTGTDAVLPVWGEDKENGIPGMRPNEPIDIRFIDNIERKSRHTRLAYIISSSPNPNLWPIDQGIISSIEFNDDPCIPTISSIFAVHNTNQNFLQADVQPNPVASRARLRYTLPAAGKVVIELWNALGQKLETLHEGYQYSGEQFLDVDVDRLPTGMYLCRIRREGAAAVYDVSTVRISVIR